MRRSHHATPRFPRFHHAFAGCGRLPFVLRVRRADGDRVRFAANSGSTARRRWNEIRGRFMRSSTAAHRNTDALSHRTRRGGRWWWIFTAVERRGGGGGSRDGAGFGRDV